MFTRFEEIEAWQEARGLAKSIRIFRRRAIEQKDFGWENQIARSALSIMANIAEGNDANTNAEFVRFLSFAKRSNAETASHLYYGWDHGYLTKDEFEGVFSQTRKIGGMLARLMMYLLKSKKNSLRISH